MRPTTCMGVGDSQSLGDRVTALEREARRSRCVANLAVAALGVALLSGQGVDEPVVRADEIVVRVLRANELVVSSPNHEARISLTIDAETGQPVIALSGGKDKAGTTLDAECVKFRNPSGFVTASLAWDGGLQLSPPDTEDNEDHRCIFLRVNSNGKRELLLASPTSRASLTCGDQDGARLLLAQGDDGPRIVVSAQPHKTLIEQISAGK